MESKPLPRSKTASADLTHLRSLVLVLPATNAGQVTAAWGEIETALVRGTKLREVWEAARLGGLEMAYPQFRVYVSRLRRRRREPAKSAPQPPPTQTNTADGLPASPVHDPFRNLRELRERKKQTKFEYDPFSITKTSSIKRSIVKDQTQASARTAEQQTAENRRSLAQKRPFEYPAGPPDESKLI
jgi:hypothetical protein